MIRVLFYFFILYFYMISSGEQNLIKLDVIKTTVFLENTLDMKRGVTASLDLAFKDDVRNYSLQVIEEAGSYHQFLERSDIINNSYSLIPFQFGFAYDDIRNYINLLSVISLCAIFMLLLSVIFI